MIADKIKWSSITPGTWCKENIRYKHIIKKQKKVPQNKKIAENKSRLGKGRAGIRYKNPNLLMA